MRNLAFFSPFTNEENGSEKFYYLPKDTQLIQRDLKMTECPKI
jgi:hypothetical protein